MLTSEQKIQIKQLFKKYINGKATPEEKVFVEKYYQYFDAADFDFENFSDKEKSEIKTSLLQKIDNRILEINNVPVLPLYRRVYMQLAVAAVFLIVIGGYGVYISQKLKPKIGLSQAMRFKNDIAPGHNGATLTLNNGQNIVLDSSGDGLVATDGAMNVMKENGEIKYEDLRSTNNNSPVYNTITTEKGKQWHLVLPDGSKVWLNAASSIHYPLSFINNERLVEISGEAYFEVVHNSSKPFKIKLPNGSIVEDIGTVFNINTYEEETISKATLVEGSIRVTNNGMSKILKPGQQAQINNYFQNSVDAIHIINDADLEETLAWKNGFFKFNGYSIDEIMKQVKNWYNVKIIYKDKIPDEFVAKIKRDMPVSEILKLLEATGLVHFEIDGNTITVIK